MSDQIHRRQLLEFTRLNVVSRVFVSICVICEKVNRSPSIDLSNCNRIESLNLAALWTKQTRPIQMKGYIYRLPQKSIRSSHILRKTTFYGLSFQFTINKTWKSQFKCLQSVKLPTEDFVAQEEKAVVKTVSEIVFLVLPCRLHTNNVICFMLWNKSAHVSKKKFPSHRKTPFTTMRYKKIIAQICINNKSDYTNGKNTYFIFWVIFLSSFLLKSTISCTFPAQCFHFSTIERKKYPLPFECI